MIYIHLGVYYLCNSDPVRLRPEYRGLDRPVDDVKEEGDQRDEDKTEPEDRAGHHDTEHPRHVAGKWYGRPETAVDHQEQKPESDAAPNTGVTEPSPGVHLDTSFEAGGDHNQGVDGITQYQVVVCFAAVPLDSSGEGSQGQPEE